MLGSTDNTKIHFIGIGGIGMSGIAEVLLALGYKVSGSDASLGPTIERLSGQGAVISIGHRAENVEGATIVVFSSAIDEKNPEIMQAREARIPLVRRAEMLAELMRLKYGIAIAGSHGKTTTTSMVATIFHEAGKDPTHIIGGIVANLGGHARKGDGDILIAEADESDGSFLYLSPTVAVVTNVDNDHLDFHKSEENIRRAFIDFINKLPFYGKAVLNGDDPGTRLILSELKRPYVLFSRGREGDWAADEVRMEPGKTTFDVWRSGVKQGRVETKVAGDHNVMNALAAVAISCEAGLGFKQVAVGISKFNGVGRRLESLWKHGNFEIIDDYGHHPTEIRATLATLKNVYKKSICAVFEPHRYSRTKELWDDFITSFKDADEVFIGPIYAASEQPIKGIDAETLVAAMRKNHLKVSYLPDLDALEELVKDRKEKNMVFLTLGAGSISRRAKVMASKL